LSPDERQASEPQSLRGWLAKMLASFSTGERRIACRKAIETIKTRVKDAAVEGFSGDLSTIAAADALAARYPELDILVNNLGIYESKPFQDITDDDWQRFFEVNVLSGARLSRLYLAGMLRKNWGRIVFISSESAIQIPADMIHYGLTKTAQLVHQVRAWGSSVELKMGCRQGATTEHM
jgi:NAD(P)-dependent dehydrogenase (short-subunit alcohol dehydrogenase family)